MTIKKFILTLSIAIFAFSTFAGDLMSVSAPVLAVESEGSVANENVATATLPPNEVAAINETQNAPATDGSVDYPVIVPVIYETVPNEIADPDVNNGSVVNPFASGDPTNAVNAQQHMASQGPDPVGHSIVNLGPSYLRATYQPREIVPNKHDSTTTIWSNDISSMTRYFNRMSDSSPSTSRPAEKGNGKVSSDKPKKKVSPTLVEARSIDAKPSVSTLVPSFESLRLGWAPRTVATSKREAVIDPISFVASPIFASVDPKVIGSPSLVSLEISPRHLQTSMPFMPIENAYTVAAFVQKLVPAPSMVDLPAFTRKVSEPAFIEPYKVSQFVPMDRAKLMEDRSVSDANLIYRRLVSFQPIIELQPLVNTNVLYRTIDVRTDRISAKDRGGDLGRLNETQFNNFDAQKVVQIPGLVESSIWPRTASMPIQVAWAAILQKTVAIDQTVEHETSTFELKPMFRSASMSGQLAGLEILQKIANKNEAVSEVPSALNQNTISRSVSMPLAVAWNGLFQRATATNPIVTQSSAVDVSESMSRSISIPSQLARLRVLNQIETADKTLAQSRSSVEIDLLPRTVTVSSQLGWMMQLKKIESVYQKVSAGPSSIEWNTISRTIATPEPVRPIVPLVPTGSIDQQVFQNTLAVELGTSPRSVLTPSPVEITSPTSVDIANSLNSANTAKIAKPETVDLAAVSAGVRTVVSPDHAKPVLISNRAELSLTQLAYVERPNAHADSAFLDSLSSIKNGPNADGLIKANEPVSSTTSAVNSAPKPVLIGGRPEFSMDLLKPMNSAGTAKQVKANATPIQKASQQASGFCDANFVGEPIRFSQTVELKLEDLLSQLHTRFGVNFIMGPNIGAKPLNVKAGSIPWNILLRSQLFISGVRARCIETNTIELIENTVLPGLQDGAAVTSKFVKLKYLQRTSGGTVDLANRSQGGQNGGQGGCGGGSGGQSGGTSGGGFGGSGGGNGGQGGQGGQTASQQGSNRFDQLIQEIEKILGIRSMTQSSPGGGGGGGNSSSTEERRTNRSVTQIPGRNILLIKATEEEFALIDEIIARADRPPFQVVIKGLVYSANQDLLRDIGVQAKIRGGNGSGRTNGGVLGDTLGVGTLFDFSTIIGTFDFNVQMTALQQNGVISVKSRPFATVLDGLCTTLSVGTKLPIVIDSTLGGQGGVTILNADNLLAVTPYVVDDENGNPVAVTLELNLQANVIDSSITARGVPAVNAKNIQTQLLLAENKTAILGGFSIDQDSKSFSKVPGLGDIPILGELFKRRIRDHRLSRLYFAITVDVIPYPEAIAPVVVPGATTDPPSITPEMKRRADEAEPKPFDPNKPDDPKKKKKDNNK